MAKRTLEDTDGMEQAHKRKKKQGQKDKSTQPETSETAGSVKPDPPATSHEQKLSKEERKEQKRLKKLRKLQEEASTEGTAQPTQSIPPPDERDRTGSERGREERKEKKRLKKLQKLQEGVDEKNGVGKLHSPDRSKDLGMSNGHGKQGANSSAVSKAVHKEKGSKDTTGGAHSISSYVQDGALTSLPQAEIDSFLSSNFITIADPLSTELRPITSFSYLPKINSLHDPFKGFTNPTPIQAAAWPFLLAGRDVVGVAETGSGKTLAFAVPCIRYITSTFQGKDLRGVKAVIVSPTRELALQIHEQVTRLAEPVGLDTVCVYGGVSKDEQRRILKTASIVVATPGRLNDLINEGVADLSRVGYMVLDEADRMLDKGFEEEIRKIINTAPSKESRQTLMFTATWPPSIRELAATFMKSPVKIAIGDNPTGDLRANTRIEQIVEVIDRYGKEQRLLQLLKQHQSGAQKNDRILVFCLYKKEATRVEGFLRMRGMRVGGIHGDLNQSQRTASLDAFKKGKVPLLVATDVAARGLDIPAVKLVINNTFPLTVEDYVHRIGRTGRAGAGGIAITLFTEEDKALSGP